jgi:serine/threonine protein kinase
MPEAMTPERWARAQEILHDALGVADAERGPLIRRLAGEDDGLRREVESLLAAHARDSLLDVAGPRPAHRMTPAMGQIGPYRLVRPLGEGGMGTVYLAERGGTDFTQIVALKLLRSGFVDPRLEERLRTERRLLARLEHPGIARLIDGGATTAGQPYVVLEYVEGRNILEYCDAQGLPVEERLRLFLEVCEAVHYAHQQLVVHRDL